MTDRRDLTDEQLAILNKTDQNFLELQGIAGTDPYLENNAASRTQMQTNNMGQWVIIERPTARLQQTGAERDHAKYTLGVKSPGNIRILKVIPRYPRTMGIDSIASNPEDLVIFENEDTREVNSMTLTTFRSLHSTFGFRYKKGPAHDKIAQGEYIREGEVILKSPCVADNGDYLMGRELRALPATFPGIAEDGILIDEEVLEDFGYKTIIRRTMSFGPDWIPLNMYGNDEAYAICPEINSYVRKDGLLIAVRPYSDSMSPYDHSKHGLQEFQEGYDQGIWIRHGGKVIDIKVIHDPLSNQARCLAGTDAQLIKYANATQQFHNRVNDEYRLIQRQRSGRAIIGDQFSNIVRTSQYYTNGGKGGARMPAEQQKARLDDWYVEFTIETHHVPDIGSKFTGLHGDKGVIVGKFKRKDAPVDDYGETAEVVVSAKATVNRSIIGRLYEPKFNAVFRDLCKDVLEDLGLDPLKQHNPNLLEAKLRKSDWRSYWAKFIRFGEIYNDEYVGKAYRAATDERKIINELINMLNGDRIMYMRTDNEKTNEQITMEFNEEMPNRTSQLWITDTTGRRHRTVEKMMISSAYYLLLDKTGDDWAAVNSSNLQHYGLLARVTNTTKYSSLVRQQPSRIWGEAEVRILVAYTPPVATAELMDRNNNRETMEAMVEHILTADDPMNIDVLIDRNKIPYGRARTTELVNHVAETHGWKFAYNDYVPTWENHRRQ